MSVAHRTALKILGHSGKDRRTRDLHVYDYIALDDLNVQPCEESHRCCSCQWKKFFIEEHVGIISILGIRKGRFPNLIYVADLSLLLFYDFVHPPTFKYAGRSQERLCFQSVVTITILAHLSFAYMYGVGLYVWSLLKSLVVSIFLSGRRVPDTAFHKCKTGDSE